MSNKLILGTVQMGLPYGINNLNGKISLSESLDILKSAHANGIQILDSAEAYGDAHEVIGAFHMKYPSKKFDVITKLPNEFNGDIFDKVDHYLKCLQVDRLHALLFHSFSSYQNSIADLHLLKQLKTEKKIQKIGVSVYTNEELLQVILNEGIDIVQVPFNLFDNSNLRGDILMKAKEKGKMVHTRSTLLQGLFFKDPEEHNRTVQSLKPELSVLNEIVSKYQIEISELALGYCLKQKYIDNVLIGVDSIQQLEQNLKALTKEIKKEIFDAINTITVQNTALLNPSLWN